MAPFRPRFPTLAAALALVLALPAEALAQAEPQGQDAGFTPSFDDYGEYGLLQMPSSRMGTDGDFSFTFSHVPPYDRYVVAVTPLPWLQADYAYVDITNQPYGPTFFSGTQTYKHTEPDFKLRLLPESASFPELSVGFRDFAGTQLFGGEYLVLTRRYYNFEFSGGLGWGYLANGSGLPNPFGFLGKSFKTRPAGAEGEFTFGYFHGPKTGVFGGVEYHTPIEGLRFKLEFDPNTYQNEPLGNVFHASAPIDAGVVYQPYNFAEISAGIERGNTVMLRISLSANFNHLGLFRDNSEPPPLVPRSSPPEPPGITLDESTIPQIEPAALETRPSEAAPTAPAAAASIDRLYAGAKHLGYAIDDIAIDGDKAVLTVAAMPHAEAGASRPALRRLALATLPDVRSAEIDILPSPAMLASAAPPVAEAPAAPAAPPLSPLAMDEASVAKRIFDQLREIGFDGQSFAISGDHAYLAFYQNKYHILSIGIGRAARIVAANSPPQVEQITLDQLDNNLQVMSVTLWRRDLENAVAEKGSPEEIWDDATITGSDPDRPPGVFNDELYPNFAWNVNPGMRQQLGGPNGFFIYEMYLALTGSVGLAPGLSVDGALGANLLNNLHELTLQSNSLLPHVRSDIAKYLKQGKTGIFRLQSDYLFNIAPDWYGRVSGGLLEEMFAGVDGEVLYRPYQQRWAVGFELSDLRQRGYKDLFTVLPYHVETGFLSFHYKLPFYNLETAVHIGRYLAGDKGATFEISRTFEGGARAGIFATKTNVSAQEFGEGAFDKGFFISFPIDLLFGSPTRSVASYVIRPLTRDGGQMLDVEKPLYDQTRDYDPSELSAMWPHLLQ